MAAEPVRQELSLGEWLDGLRRAAADPREAWFVLGATGHLVPSPAEEDEAAAHLRMHVLPRIARQLGRGQRCAIASGGAPGADLLFMRLAAASLRQSEAQLTSVILLPVPPDRLFEDWVIRREAEGPPLSPQARARARAEFQRQIDGADVHVMLYGAEAAECAASADWREDQYRRLAACLAERSDVLVAVLRAQKLREPGGTAEVVEWRRHPQRIPRRFSTLLPGERSNERHEHALIVIDPAVAWTEEAMHDDAASPSGEVAAILAEAERALQHGNDLLCYDVLQRAWRRGIRARRLDHLRIRALANAGSTELALEQYLDLDLPAGELDEDWLALRGRLEKDLALAGAGTEARQHFRTAGQAYFAAYRRWAGHYSAINAASMFLLAGHHIPARMLAAEVLRLVTAEPEPDGEAQRYYRRASEAEAALLLHDLPRAEDALRRADALLRHDLTSRARTRRQLLRLCTELRVDPTFLSALALPTVFFVRLAPEAADAPEVLPLELPQELAPASPVFLSLSRPSDLGLAEALLERGALLHLTLPMSLPLLHESWLQRWGREACERLAAVARRSERIAALAGFLDAEQVWCQSELDAMALGLSLSAAMHFGAQWQAWRVRPASARLVFEPAEPLSAPVTAAAEALRALATGHAAAMQDELGKALDKALGKRRMIGILFADFAGFRRIADADLPLFWDELMGRIAQMIDRRGAQVLLRSTWGDAVHVVARDATSIAELAADIQEYIAARRRVREGPVADLELRIAVHYAPAFEGDDPIRGARIFYGSQLSFAARIEPVAPPGTVFGSEPFVARLALEAPERFTAAYAGEIELAKRHGRYRLFALKRRARR